MQETGNSKAENYKRMVRAGSRMFRGMHVKGCKYLEVRTDQLFINGGGSYKLEVTSMLMGGRGGSIEKCEATSTVCWCWWWGGGILMVRIDQYFRVFWFGGEVISEKCPHCWQGFLSTCSFLIVVPKILQYHK